MFYRVLTQQLYLSRDVKRCLLLKNDYDRQMQQRLFAIFTST